MTSIASTTTALSTQPPETEPSKLPARSMTSWLPAGRGADRQAADEIARRNGARKRRGLPGPRLHALQVALLHSAGAHACREPALHRIGCGHRCLIAGSGADVLRGNGSARATAEGAGENGFF